MSIIEDEWAPSQFSPAVATFDRIGSERKFGVELEYDVIDDYEVIQSETVFGGKEDCSVNGGEFDSPILYADQGLAAVDKFCNLADELGFEASDGAGYHLHVDMRGETAEGLKRIALGYHYTRRFWMGTVPQHRRNHEYSRLNDWGRNDVLESGDDIRGFREFIREKTERYTWLNVGAYSTHQTFELRCHEGVTDGNTVNNWVIAHTRFCDALSAMSIGRITRVFGRKKPTEIFREMRAIFQDPTVSEHLRARYRQFNS